MSEWKELPKPATPGPWVYEETPDWSNLRHSIYSDDEHTPPEDLGTARKLADAAAIAALPDYVAEVARLRAWVDALEVSVARGGNECAIRAGEWPEGRQP